MPDDWIHVKDPRFGSECRILASDPDFLTATLALSGGLQLPQLPPRHPAAVQRQQRLRVKRLIRQRGRGSHRVDLGDRLAAPHGAPTFA